MTKEGNSTPFRSWIVLLLIVLGVVGLLLAIAPMSCVPARRIAQRDACRNNLRQLQVALDSAALAQNVKSGARIPDEMFVEYFKGKMRPECPGGGTYIIPPAGGLVECSIHGKVELPKTNSTPNP